jgi:hypothetical protein
MNKNPKAKTNILEALKELGTHTTKTFTNDLLKESANEFVDQIFGKIPKRHLTSEIAAGEQIFVPDVLSGRQEKLEKERKQIFHEQILLKEEKELMEKRTNELQVKLHAITQEIQMVSQAMPKVTEEVETAKLQAPINPGIYHIIFFDKILEGLRDLRKRIENASEWLTIANLRAQKKTYWSLYKKHGGKFLLSSEHYLQRSAG